MRNMKGKWIFIVPAAIVGMLLFMAIGGWAVQLLWNWLLPPLFGWRQITFWEALGLLALCRILFGGFGRSGGYSGVRRRTADRIADRVADRMTERWAGMTSDERERFRQRVRERFGFDPSASESKGH